MNTNSSAARGIVLIVVLILLIVISLVAALAVQRSISGEQVSKALRTQTEAFQAAETALRYCENQILENSTISNGTSLHTPHPVPLDGTAPALWKDRANWASRAGKAVAIDDKLANSSDPAARTLTVLPQCMAERIDLPGDGARREAFVVTAVGYSPDYRATNGKPESGGEVWLQSTVTPKP